MSNVLEVRVQWIIMHVTIKLIVKANNLLLLMKSILNCDVIIYRGGVGVFPCIMSCDWIIIIRKALMCFSIVSCYYKLIIYQ